MFFSLIFIVAAFLTGATQADTAHATNTVEQISVISTVEVSEDSITSYVG